MTAHTGEGTVSISTSLVASGKLSFNVSGTVAAALALAGNVVPSPRLSGASVIGVNTLRVTFNQAMKKDTRLTSPFQWTITPATDGVAVYVTAVTPENVANPSYVDLTINETTTGKPYQVRVASGASGPVSTYDLTISLANSAYSFNGIGVNPTVSRVEAIGANRADVVFSEPMLDNAAIRTASKYTWDNGLTTIAVLEVASDRVKLITSTQTAGVLYTLTIS